MAELDVKEQMARLLKAVQEQTAKIDRLGGDVAAVDKKVGALHERRPANRHEGHGQLGRNLVMETPPCTGCVSAAPRGAPPTPRRRPVVVFEQDKRTPTKCSMFGSGVDVFDAKAATASLPLRTKCTAVPVHSEDPTFVMLTPFAVPKLDAPAHTRYSTKRSDIQLHTFTPRETRSIQHKGQALRPAPWPSFINDTGDFQLRSPWPPFRGLKIAYRPGENFNHRDFQHAVEKLPLDGFLPEQHGSVPTEDVSLQNLFSNRAIYSWATDDISKKVITICLSAQNAEPLWKSLMEASEQCITVELVMLETEAVAFMYDEVSENSNSFIHRISDLENCVVRRYSPEAQVLHGLVKRWLEELKYDKEETGQAVFAFRVPIIKSVNQISCSQSDHDTRGRGPCCSHRGHNHPKIVAPKCSTEGFNDDTSLATLAFALGVFLLTRMPRDYFNSSLMTPIGANWRCANVEKVVISQLFHINDYINITKKQIEHVTKPIIIKDSLLLNSRLLVELSCASTYFGGRGIPMNMSVTWVCWQLKHPQQWCPPGRAELSGMIPSFLLPMDVSHMQSNLFHKESPCSLHMESTHSITQLQFCSSSVLLIFEQFDWQIAWPSFVHSQDRGQLNDDRSLESWFGFCITGDLVSKLLGLSLGEDTSSRTNKATFMFGEMHSCDPISGFLHEKLWDPGGFYSCASYCQGRVVFVKSKSRLIGVHSEKPWSPLQAIPETWSFSCELPAVGIPGKCLLYMQLFLAMDLFITQHMDFVLFLQLKFPQPPPVNALISGSSKFLFPMVHWIILVCTSKRNSGDQHKCEWRAHFLFAEIILEARNSQTKSDICWQYVQTCGANGRLFTKLEFLITNSNLFPNGTTDFQPWSPLSCLTLMQHTIIASLNSQLDGFLNCTKIELSEFLLNNDCPNEDWLTYHITSTFMGRCDQFQWMVAWPHHLPLPFYLTYASRPPRRPPEPAVASNQNCGVQRQPMPWPSLISEMGLEHRKESCPPTEGTHMRQSRAQPEPLQGGRDVTAQATFSEQAPVGHRYYFDQAHANNDCYLDKAAFSFDFIQVHVGHGYYGDGYLRDSSSTKECQVSWHPGGNSTTSAWGQAAIQGGRIVSDPAQAAVGLALDWGWWSWPSKQQRL